MSFLCALFPVDLLDHPTISILKFVIFYISYYNNFPDFLPKIHFLDMLFKHYLDVIFAVVGRNNCLLFFLESIIFM